MLRPGKSPELTGQIADASVTPMTTIRLAEWFPQW